MTVPLTVSLFQRHSTVRRVNNHQASQAIILRITAHLRIYRVSNGWCLIGRESDSLIDSQARDLPVSSHLADAMTLTWVPEYCELRVLHDLDPPFDGAIMPS
jgi:hypothetical protein